VPLSCGLARHQPRASSPSSQRAVSRYFESTATEVYIHLHRPPETPPTTSCGDRHVEIGEAPGEEKRLFGRPVWWLPAGFVSARKADRRDRRPRRVYAICANRLYIVP